jgi:hypothetical protein
MIKDEVRVLIVHYLSSDLLIYLVLRGVKGVEHLGLINGSFNDLINYLSSTNLMDEVRYIVLPGNEVFRVYGRDRTLSKVSNDELSSLTSMVVEGRRVLNMVADELRFITTLSKNTFKGCVADG